MKKPGRPKLGNTISKSYRWPSDITEYVDWYKAEHSITETTATIQLMRDAILLNLHREYNKETPHE